MLIPLRDQNGMIIPTTADGVRNMPMVPNPGGGFPVDNAPNPRTPAPGGLPASPGGMTDIPYAPPKQQAALPFLGQPFGASSDMPKTQFPQSTPRQDRLGGAPSVLPLPLDVESQPAPSTPDATPLQPQQEQGADAPQSGEDMRRYLKIAGATLLQSSSPAERVQGMQMLFEASQPTPGEVARGERERVRGVVGRANVDPDLIHSADIAADLGASPEIIMKTLGLDADSRAKKDKVRTHAAEVLDKAYAPKYVEFKLQDQSGMSKSLTQLQDVQTLLKQPGVKITGPVQGLIPDSLKAFTEGGQRAITARELTHEVIQQSLRQILGAQFTKDEGDRLMARTFNDKLSPEENQMRVGRLARQIQEAYVDQAAAAQYFEENGTLAGYKGRPVPTLADIENRAREEQQHPARSGQGKQVNQQGKAGSLRRPDKPNEVLLREAQEAIEAGADAAAVGRQLTEWGVEPR